MNIKFGILSRLQSKDHMCLLGATSILSSYV